MGSVDGVAESFRIVDVNAKLRKWAAKSVVPLPLPIATPSERALPSPSVRHHEICCRVCLTMTRSVLPFLTTGSLASEFLRSPEARSPTCYLTLLPRELLLKVRPWHDEILLCV